MSRLGSGQAGARARTTEPGDFRQDRGIHLSPVTTVKRAVIRGGLEFRIPDDSLGCWRPIIILIRFVAAHNCSCNKRKPRKRDSHSPRINNTSNYAAHYQRFMKTVFQFLRCEAVIMWIIVAAFARVRARNKKRTAQFHTKAHFLREREELNTFGI